MSTVNFIVLAVVVQLYGAIFVEAVWTVKSKADASERDLRERCFICHLEHKAMNFVKMSHGRNIGHGFNRDRCSSNLGLRSLMFIPKNLIIHSITCFTFVTCTGQSV